MDMNLRVDNLESNYPRLADSFRRIADVVETHTKKLESLAKSMLGFPDPETNLYVPGYAQRIEKLEECIMVSNRRWSKILSAAKDIFIMVVSAVILYKLGMK